MAETYIIRNVSINREDGNFHSNRNSDEITTYSNGLPAGGATFLDLLPSQKTSFMEQSST